MPVYSCIEWHSIVNSDLDIVIFVADKCWPRKLAIDLDHLPFLAIGCPELPCDDPVFLDNRTCYTCQEHPYEQQTWQPRRGVHIGALNQQVSCDKDLDEKYSKDTTE
mgnify:FL=1